MGDVTVVAGEREFGIGELFFSTTDRGGRIQAGNPVFARVSGYDFEEEMRGRAHNLIRHPDMPRSVFRLFWDVLGEEHPIAAYVKNRAKDGRHYWVVAIATPVPDGYLSVRFKPSSPIFPVVQAVYADVLAAERAAEQDGAKRDDVIAAGEARLAEALAGLGFRDYDAFMQVFLAEEMRAREAALAGGEAWGALWARGSEGRRGSPRRVALADVLDGFRVARMRMDARFSDVQEYTRLNDALANRSRDLVGEMHLQSLNMLLAAARLGDQGASLGVVARLMGTEADAGRGLMATLEEHGEALGAVLRALGFQIAVGRLQCEMAVFFGHEMLVGDGGEDDEDLAGNVALLSGALAESLARIDEASRELGRAIGRAVADIGALLRLLKTLGALQVNGTIEAAAVDGADETAQMLVEMSAQVATAHDEIAELSRAAAAARIRARRADHDDLAGEVARLGQAFDLIAA